MRVKQEGMMPRMRLFILLLFILTCRNPLLGQSSGSSVGTVTAYSQNGRFYLRSVPFDNEFPTLRGRTSVYESGRAKPLYVFERGFDSVGWDSHNLILSNDGEVIFYVAWGGDEEIEELKSITVYRRGKLLKSYTEMEITGCDKRQERCGLVYSNYDEVIDQEKNARV